MKGVRRLGTATTEGRDVEHAQRVYGAAGLMRARTLRRPRPHDVSRRPPARTGARGLRPRAFPRGAGEPKPSAKAELSRLRLAPAAEDEPAQGEAEPECPQREPADR